MKSDLIKLLLILSLFSLLLCSPSTFASVKKRLTLKGDPFKKYKIRKIRRRILRRKLKR
jgi:hypothetical protein